MKAVMPGPDAPYQACSPREIAELFGVAAARVEAWLAAGLPQDDGLIDPMTACNWITLGPLAEAPVLSRRWRSYLAWFRPFVEGRDEARTVRWEREHAIFLPRDCRDLSWWLPEPIQHDRQQVGQPTAWSRAVSQSDTHSRIDIAEPSTTERMTGTCTVRVEPSRVGEDAVAALAELRAAVAEWIQEFTYIYRRHAHGDGDPAAAPRVGTCLDCALGFARHCAAAGWRWRLMAGVVARDEVSNAHYWLEVSDGGTWYPVDPSLPAIARMLGEDPAPWIAAYTGGCDARRILLAQDPHPLGDQDMPVFCSMSPGEAVVTHSDERCDAWGCIDWVLGATSGSFSLV